jgi:hypothetical protein
MSENTEDCSFHVIRVRNSVLTARTRHDFRWADVSGVPEVASSWAQNGIAVTGAGN